METKLDKGLQQVRLPTLKLITREQQKISKHLDSLEAIDGVT